MITKVGKNGLKIKAMINENHAIYQSQHKYNLELQFVSYSKSVI